MNPPKQFERDGLRPRTISRLNRFRGFSGRLAKEVCAVDAAGADWIHVNMMDGRFSDAVAQEAS